MKLSTVLAALLLAVPPSSQELYTSAKQFWMALIARRLRTYKTVTQLTGLKDFGVRVQITSDYLKYKKEALSALELSLKANKISHHPFDRKDKAALVVNIDFIRTSFGTAGRTCAYVVLSGGIGFAEGHQLIPLTKFAVHDEAITFYTPRKDLTEVVRTSVRRVADDFSLAWYKANEKKSSPVK